MKKLLILPLIFLSTYAFAGYDVTGNLRVTGNIGVGSSTPRAKVDVAGDIYGVAFYGSGAGLTGLPASGLTFVTIGSGLTGSGTVDSPLLVDPNIYQQTLVSGTNIKTINGYSVLGSGDLTVSGTGSGTPGGTDTQIQYNRSGAFGGVDGFIYNGTSITYTGNIGISTTAPTQKLNVVGNILATGTVTGSNLSGTNTGDNATNSQYSGLVSNATHTGDVTGATALTIASATSSTWAGRVSDEVGTGYWVFNASPNFTGNIGIGTTGARSSLEVGNAATITAGSSPAVAVKGNVMVDGKIYGDGSALTGLASGISGLTSTRVPVASGSTTIVDSVIYNVGNNVGIGTTAPAYGLEVKASFGVGSTGNVGIGTTAPIGKLQVDGTIYSKNLTVGGNHGTAKQLWLGTDGSIYAN